MRHAIFGILTVAVLGWQTPPLSAQYPFPYAPPPQYPSMPYGYPPPMMPAPMMGPSAYMPNPGMARPAYYNPPPMPISPVYPVQAIGAPRVYNFSPAVDNSAPPPVSGMPGARMPTTPGKVQPTQNTVVPTSPPTGGMMPEAPVPSSCGPAGCGPEGCPPGGCADGCCLPALRPFVAPPVHPRGHIIGSVGVNVLMPFPESKTAYTKTTSSGTSNTTFSDQVLAGPRLLIGYVYHNGWGLRADGWNLIGSTGLGTTNSDVTGTTVISTPGAAPFQIISPSATNTNLTAGLGSDQWAFRRAFDIRIADAEVIKECTMFDLFFVIGAGARYANIQQSYTASRTNNVGSATVLDREDLGFLSRFTGWGPTLSLEGIHPIKGCCLSLYGNIRGSAIIGTEQFSQNYSAFSIAPNSIATPGPSVSRVTTDSRIVPMAEIETGLQAGKRIGGCYLYGRLGAIASRWWNVGNPYGTTGNLDLLGGTVSIGLIY